MARSPSARPPRKALREGPNQYPPMQGLIELRQAVAAHSRRFYDLDFDPETEILITSGATEALTDCMHGPGRRRATRRS